MSKPRNRPPQEISAVDSQTLAAAADPGLFRFSFLGSSRHVLNWRIGEVRRLKDGEARSFLLSHPDLVLETPLAPPPPRNYVMPRFRIGPDNLVAVMAPGEEAPEDNAVFSSSLELLRASHGWRPTRLVKIWNGIAGVEPIRHFETKLAAISRIWNAIQPLVAPQPDRKGVGSRRQIKRG